MRCGIRSIDERHLRAVEMEGDEVAVVPGLWGFGGVLSFENLTFED